MGAIIIRIVETGKMHSEMTVLDTAPLPDVNDYVVVDSGLTLVVKDRVFRYIPTGDVYHYLLVVLSCVPVVTPDDPTN